ncbi:MAG TPA: FAD-dependent oxidoreductase, partial [Rhodocyclaceae bacterium]|nr:FAD-dependent oxidoreductase [Rhodocyclaceae bacterium]
AAAGLTVGRGITVDRRLATSDPHIFALGDCAEVDGLHLPFVLPLMQQARALARSLTGTPTDLSYPPMPVLVKTPAIPTIVAPPPIGAAGVWRIVEDTPDAGLEARFEAPDGSLRGFALLGPATARKQTLSAALPALL